MTLFVRSMPIIILSSVLFGATANTILISPSNPIVDLVGKSEYQTTVNVTSLALIGTGDNNGITGVDLSAVERVALRNFHPESDHSLIEIEMKSADVTHWYGELINGFGQANFISVGSGSSENASHLIGSISAFDYIYQLTYLDDGYLLKMKLASSFPQD
mmetsp:Transcript_65517/g.77562  ORF Transcript_65517/g.77562 Transcript_65517/m.77562 type:complete len:160 (-) Transcript_65517:215-694(-)|eukprot:CAMPEP_0172497644 /NCGR_PEP_ID=MMETSP1066-20121228/102700_1 /TAXON_ID=671091 /ORGANISM="Coscinodiscus wailesii, Strain CCMP2513" /LENGTH=159 /DNA_ID=CAMNT_0013270523 /DNA_START=56 /DNA_END=535 /DNA_ORIENTATION=+